MFWPTIYESQYSRFTITSSWLIHLKSLEWSWNGVKGDGNPRPGGKEGFFTQSCWKFPGKLLSGKFINSHSRVTLNGQTWELRYLNISGKGCVHFLKFWRGLTPLQRRNKRRCRSTISKFCQFCRNISLMDNSAMTKVPLILQFYCQNVVPKYVLTFIIL